MFTMMNNARLAVGVQGVAVADRACQQALAYAHDRKQGKATGASATSPIVEHPDVRRMLIEMRSKTAAARAICLVTAAALDRHHRLDGAAARRQRGEQRPEGENDFQTSINTILSGDTVKQNQFGYVACLPSVYVRDIAQTKVKRAARSVEEGYLAEIGAQLKDLDAEIISSIKSKNFEGYNIDAIINNRMASWLNKTNLNLGACVIVKAKVKDHSKHWKHSNDVTRLNYVKAAQ
jgi:hypothetical protein